MQLTGSPMSASPPSMCPSRTGITAPGAPPSKTAGCPSSPQSPQFSPGSNQPSLVRSDASGNHHHRHPRSQMVRRACPRRPKTNSVKAQWPIQHRVAKDPSLLGKACLRNIAVLRHEAVHHHGPRCKPTLCDTARASSKVVLKPGEIWGGGPAVAPSSMTTAEVR